MSSIARILDANANRAREALRVLEDAARFALNDSALSSQLKTLRHDLAAALAVLPGGWIEANRDTAGDVGTGITASGEGDRAGLPDVVIAAGRRAGEALRVLEETGKTLEPSPARDLEAIRYRLYEVEATLHRRLGTGRARQWRVCVLLTEQCCARPWRDVLRGVLDAGADCVQVREKSMADAALADRVAEVVEVARPAGASVIVNDRVDVAAAAGADGAHLGADDLPITAARRLVGRELLLGASTHDLDEAAAAVEAGADYCGVGTMFPTGTKAHLKAAGPAVLEAYLERFARVPHLAIGGVTPRNVDRLVEAGARGVAVCSAVCSAPDPARVVEALRQALNRSGPEVAGMLSGDAHGHARR